SSVRIAPESFRFACSIPLMGIILYRWQVQFLEICVLAAKKESLILVLYRTPRYLHFFPFHRPRCCRLIESTSPWPRMRKLWQAFPPSLLFEILIVHRIAKHLHEIDG